MPPHVESGEVPPDRILMHMLTGMWTTKAIAVAVRLRIPDLLHDGGRTSAEIAAATECQPRAMHRLLRALASVGVVGAMPPDRFGPTALSERLRDVPGTLRNVFIAETDAVHWHSWHLLLDAVRTGAPQPEVAAGASVFDYYGRHREEGEQFGRAMQDVSAMVAAGVLEHYDFGPFDTLADVGGGNGSLVRAVLQHDRRVHGLIVDLPYIGAQAEQGIHDSGLADRCRFVASDFFKEVPPADLYLLKFILHDWDDDDCVRILERCLAAARPGARVLIVEMLVPADNSAPMVAFMDLNMLVMTGGLERTGEEYHALLRRGGFTPTRVIATGTPFALIEGTS